MRDAAAGHCLPACQQALEVESWVHNSEVLRAVAASAAAAAALLWC